jgi:hypothetical protein
MVHMASSCRSCGSKAKDGWFDDVGCGVVEVRPNYPSLDVIFLLAHRGILVFCFHYNRTPKGWCRGKHSAIPLLFPSYSCFLRDVDVLHSVRVERRESERSIQSSKEWKNIVTVSAPCKLLILINIVVCLC